MLGLFKKSIRSILFEEDRLYLFKDNKWVGTIILSDKREYSNEDNDYTHFKFKKPKGETEPIVIERVYEIIFPFKNCFKLDWLLSSNQIQRTLTKLILEQEYEEEPDKT